MGHAIGADLMERYEFDSEGDRLVGNLHLPQGDAHGVAILTGPLTSVKEQATGAGFSYDGVNPPAANFGAGTAFGPVPIADFVVGVNTVDFVVWDSTVPATGIDFKFVVTESCPGT